MCEHYECPYKYCPYHENYDKDLEVICKYKILDYECGETVENCESYLDI